MAIALSTTRFSFGLTGGESNTITTYGSISFPATLSQRVSFADGTGSGQAQHLAIVSLAVPVAGIEIDLNAMVHPFGTANFTAIKGIVIYNSSATAAEIVTVGGSTANVFLFGSSSANTFAVQPGDCFQQTWSVTGQTTSSKNTIKFAAASGTVTTYVYVLGIGSVA